MKYKIYRYDEKGTCILTKDGRIYIGIGEKNDDISRFIKTLEYFQDDEWNYLSSELSSKFLANLEYTGIELESLDREYLENNFPHYFIC